MNKHINRRTLLRAGSTALLAATLAACSMRASSTPTPQPTTSAGLPTAIIGQPTAIIGQPTTPAAKPTGGNGTAATAQPSVQPTFAFTP